MNLTKIKEDIELASIDYADRYKVSYYYSEYIQWIVRDRSTGKDIEKMTYYSITTLPKAARKYRYACQVNIQVYGVDNQSKFEAGETIVDKFNVLNEYDYYDKPSYLDYGRYFKISFVLVDGKILSVPKRTK